MTHKKPKTTLPVLTVQKDPTELDWGSPELRAMSKPSPWGSYGAAATLVKYLDMGIITEKEADIMAAHQTAGVSGRKIGPPLKPLTAKKLAKIRFYGHMGQVFDGYIISIIGSVVKMLDGDGVTRCTDMDRCQLIEAAPKDVDSYKELAHKLGMVAESEELEALCPVPILEQRPVNW